MGDGQHGDVRMVPFQGAVDGGFGDRVDRRCCVVEHQNAWIRQERPGERDTLTLTTGERQALLSHGGVVPVLEIHDEVVGLCRPCRCVDRLVVHLPVSCPHRDVLPDRRGVEERLVEDTDDGLAESGRRHLGEIRPGAVDAGEQDASRVGGVETSEQLDQHRLAGTWGTNERHRGSRGDIQGQPGQDRTGVLGEAHLVELNPDRSRWDAGAGPFRGEVHRGAEIDHLEDALDRTRPHLQSDDGRREYPGDRRERGQIGREGYERAHGDAAVEGQPTPDGDVDHEGEHRQLVQRRLKPGVDAGGTHAVGVELAARVLHPGDLVLLLGERLDHPHPGDGLLDPGGQVRGLLLGRPRGGEEALPPSGAEEHDDRQCRQRDGREQRRQPEHHHRGQGELQHVPDGQGEDRQDALHRVDVRDGTADHLTRPECILPRSVQALQGVEQLDPETLLGVQ